MRRQYFRKTIESLKIAAKSLGTAKKRVLRKYIDKCATRIQAAYKGHRVRHTQLPLLRKLKSSRGLLMALAFGWRVRRIMQTQEVAMRIK